MHTQFLSFTSPSNNRGHRHHPCSGTGGTWSGSVEKNLLNISLDVSNKNYYPHLRLLNNNKMKIIEIAAFTTFSLRTNLYDTSKVEYFETPVPFLYQQRTELRLLKNTAFVSSQQE